MSTVNPTKVPRIDRPPAGDGLRRRMAKFWNHGLAGAAVVLMAFTQGCGGGGSPGVTSVPTPTPAPEQGEVVIALTDAPGDFTGYVVEVESLELVRANGDVVETLPLTTTVDFSELTEVTEFLTVATVPAGNYTSVSMTLNYAAAQVWVEDASGVEVQALVQDVNGDEITTMKMHVQLPNTDVIRIRPGIPAMVSVDFDLGASNTVDLDGPVPVVTVEPFLLAIPELEADRAHRLRGALADVDIDASTVTLKVRPFRHRLRDFGRFTFSTSSETLWEIDGDNFVGSAGLEALAAKPDNTPVIAGGTIDDARRFVAGTVLAGTSVPWTDHDVAHGVVVAREGDALTLRGGRIEYMDGSERVRGEFTVLLGDETKVTSLLIDAADKDAISIGQRITAFGEIVADGTIDATEGRVRMHITSMTGTVLDGESLTVEVLRMNGRNPEVYDFAAAGSDPSAYEVDTGLLLLESIEPGDLVRIRGNVNGWLQAPPDFNAVTVIDVAVDSRHARLAASWAHLGGTAVPFSAIAPERLEVDLTEARSVLKFAGIPADHLDLETIGIVAPGIGGVWGVYVRGSGEMHTFIGNFGALVDELREQLEAGRVMVSIGASGKYNSESGDLTSGRAIFVFQTP